jgi:Rrf2 family protein
MRLSTRTRFGARALAELAAAPPNNVVSLREIAEKQRIAVKYLEQIVNRLKRAGLVRAVRGMHGGYALARPPGRITLKEVCEVLEGSFSVVDCVDHPGSCLLEDVCPTRETWAEMKGTMMGVLERTTLEDLVARKDRKARGPVPMYHI